MSAAARPGWYDWPGGREALLRFGPDTGPVVVAALPLFEEANRTRRLVVDLLRRLADRGIGGILPDLPGQGDSLVPTENARLSDWRTAFAAAVATAQPAYVVAIRGGALVDGDARPRGRLHLCPEPGKTHVRNLLRARKLASLADGTPLVADDPRTPGPPLMLAGNRIDRALLTALLDAKPDRADRTLELWPSPAPADRLLAPEGPPNADQEPPRFRRPWTTAEPGDHPELAEALADDVAAWIARCEA